MDLNFVQMEFLNFSNSIYQPIKPSNQTFTSVLCTIIGSVLAVYLFKKFIRFKRICDVMANIPGPPNHFLLGNAILVLYLDKFNFKYGTYCRKWSLFNIFDNYFHINIFYYFFLNLKSMTHHSLSFQYSFKWVRLLICCLDNTKFAKCGLASNRLLYFSHRKLSRR